MSHVDEGTLHAYLDGELAGEERARLEEHLAGCAACRDRLAEARGLIERADRLLTLAELPAGHTHRAAPAPVQSPFRRRPRLLVPVAWAATIALAFLGGWLLRPAPVSQLSDANETRQLAAAAPADSTASLQPAPVRDAPAPPTAPYRPRAERRQAAKATPDSAATRSEIGYAPSDTSAGVKVTPGVVENAARPGLRGAAPTPIPPATVAVTPSAGAPPARPAADVTSERIERRPIGTTWTVIAADPARRALGTDPVQIPGLPVRDILQNPLAPGEVMVEQEVADGTIIQLLQSRLDSTVGLMASQSMAMAGNPLQKTVGRLQVRIVGPLKTDSLLKLLDLAR